MVKYLLNTVDDLSKSGFGRPSPRHGLQLLFWFAKECVTVNPNGALSMVAGIQPETGQYGFHYFGNFEAILPKPPGNTQYFEVGNLNTETYPDGARLPGYVRESSATSDGYPKRRNMDRLIICYKARSRVVMAVYVTQHLSGSSSREFDPDRTHSVKPKLIRALQNKQFHLHTFLIQTGYFKEHEFHRGYPTLDNYAELDNYTDPSNYANPANYTGTSQNDTELVGKEELAVYWEPFHAGNRRDQRRYSQPDDGNSSGRWRRHVLAVLLGAGALFVAFKCLSGVSSRWEMRLSGSSATFTTSSIPHHSHPVMLDYVF